jgi:hypothetical protein
MAEYRPTWRIGDDLDREATTQNINDCSDGSSSSVMCRYDSDQEAKLCYGICEDVT